MAVLAFLRGEQAVYVLERTSCSYLPAFESRSAASPPRTKLAWQLSTARVAGFRLANAQRTGVIAEKRIAKIVSTVLPGIATFLLTAEPDAQSIVEQVRRTRVNTLQLVDRLPSGTHKALPMALPGVGLLQVVHVTGPESIDEGLAVAPVVDAILLDSGNPTLAVKQLGGTGRVHDWEVSRQFAKLLIGRSFGRRPAPRQRGRGDSHRAAFRSRRLQRSEDQR